MIARGTGPSMLPSLASNNIILFNTFEKPFNQQFKVGDVVLIDCWNDGYITKRILALPETTFETRYAEKMYIPKNHVWIEGDNKENSFDSRHYGPVPIHLISGIGYYQLYP
jgi:mitochondrial inner membrane protease subunit 1